MVESAYGGICFTVKSLRSIGRLARLCMKYPGFRLVLSSTMHILRYNSCSVTFERLKQESVLPNRPSVNP